MTLEELKELKHPKCFYTKEETDAILKSISQKVVVEQLPQYGNEGYLYLVPSIVDPNVYEQFIWNNDTWKSLGTVNKEEYLDYVTNPELDIALSGKQDKLTFDSAPTLGSSNPVTSDGLYTEFMNVHEILDGLSMNYVIIGRVNSDDSVTFYHASSVGINPIPASDVVQILEANTSQTVGLQLGFEFIRLYVNSLVNNSVILIGHDWLDSGYPQVIIDGDTAQYYLLPTLSQLDTVPTSGSGKLLSSGSVYTALRGKQNTIGDLLTIRRGAALGATAYQKPSGGIPKSDLASAVQTSLGKADTALQSFTESDPTVPSHVKNITQANITSWNTKQDVSPITNTASGALTVNEYRDFGSVSALTVTLTGGTMANYDLYKFAFTCASDSTTLTLPSGVKLPVDMEMVMATGRRFECTIDYANCLTFNCWD